VERQKGSVLESRHIYGGGWEPWFNYSYDAAGNMTKRQAIMGGINDSLNVPTEWYDGLNRPTTWENTGANDVPFARSHYQYDNVGREAATWRDEQSSKGEKFWYTLNGQLAVAEYNANQVWTGNPSTWDRWVGYSYTADRLNRSSVNDNGSITNYAVSALNQYVSTNGETIYHDAQLQRLNARGLVLLLRRPEPAHQRPGLDGDRAPPEHLRRPGPVREARRIRVGWFGSLGDLRWLETNR
jgi:hypothetical protein